MKIIDEYKATDSEGLTEYLVKETDETRITEIFAYLPLWLNKFVWLKRVKVLERKHIIKKLIFDEYYCQSFWTKPYEEWIKESIF